MPLDSTCAVLASGEPDARDCREHRDVWATLQSCVVYMGGASVHGCVWGRGLRAEAGFHHGAVHREGRGLSSALETSQILNFRWLQWVGSLPPYTNIQCPGSCNLIGTLRVSAILKCRAELFGEKKLNVWVVTSSTQKVIFFLVSHFVTLLKWQLHLTQSALPPLTLRQLTPKSNVDIWE